MINLDSEISPSLQIDLQHQRPIGFILLLGSITEGM